MSYSYSYSSYSPSRKAPSSPTSYNYYNNDNLADHSSSGIPPNHPFATYYIPPTLHHCSSDSSLSLSSKFEKSEQYSRYGVNPSSGQSTRSYNTTSTSSRSSKEKDRSPTSSLAQPLSPRSPAPAGAGQYPLLGHFGVQSLDRTISASQIQARQRDRERERERERGGTDTTREYATHPAYSYSYSYSYSGSSPSSPGASSYAIPTELTLFDDKAKHNLLGDLEFIAGKKFSFAFLNKLNKRTTKWVKDEKVREQDKDNKITKRLTEDRYVEGWEWTREGLDELVPPQVVVVDRKRGRGVREGNYI
ncbi:uncharacterized protein I303_103870 [Kwoniella dejecticola CBS 10117]|uniref:Uncharacterized protein n=1 Tax=Kwoniella dejecticola CBS 10117 TaxID=1296121 RepID=A0A1A6A7Y4_9TREE|nr:uncharacterized protein I303_03889 [Kwoniella dejecticola CBS 10117]OBR86169.1 hypothetical protein I303_03889 [Kwoniella dejecticola CBS 10117]